MHARYAWRLEVGKNYTLESNLQDAVENAPKRLGHNVQTIEASQVTLDRLVGKTLLELKLNVNIPTDIIWIS
jgi:hypothetical protein